jgi:hypothetical protein
MIGMITISAESITEKLGVFVGLDVIFREAVSAL